MKKTLAILVRVSLLFLIIFTPLNSSAVLSQSGKVSVANVAESIGKQRTAAEENNVRSRPAGRWTTQCDSINVLHITWITEIRLKGGIFIIESEFNNFAERFGKKASPNLDGVESSVTAFKIMLEPDTIWLEIMSDGTFAPENTGFNQSVVAYAYPGGYKAIAEELNSLGIDWEELYTELKASALEIRKSVDSTFCSPPPKKQGWPRFLTG